ncbi:undecaprenyl/decaprenyl-phosphate alpha-N-acetylglucosaminyl 1-phosphate transferase [Candidatus Gracilibacteria bacterium]|nr:undecaprenyl/decaprenyl-phosphate alpha-N-acetylglucosaminyl 1-phosphate transferase [Candidatus Gracilibacteria bacterium]
MSPIFTNLLGLACISLVVGFSILRCILFLAKKYDILDRPHLYKTEAGRKPVPYGIGIAIISTLLLVAPVIPYLFDISPTLEKKLFIVLSLSAIIGIISALDDLDTIGKSRISVPPLFRLLMQIGVGLVIGITSIKISYISNLFGGTLPLDEYFFQIDLLGKIFTIYYIPLFITVFWYVLVFNSINFSDGIPGLAGGFSLISFIILGFLALKLYFTDTTEAAVENSQFILILVMILLPITALVTAHDIKRTGIMGDSGTILLAFFIATLAIVAGGKIATAMSVIGIYLIDLIYVVGIRIMQGKSPMKGDQTHHLHFRLLELGFTHANIRNIIYILAASFGVAAIFLDTGGKIILFIFITIITLFMTKILSIVRKK